MKTAFIFPGQGAQAVGMGKDLYESFPAAKVVFDAAEAVCGLPLKRLCFEGPEDELNRTDNAQPAIFTVSAAMLACMRGRLGGEKAGALRPAFMAGLSLGEYTALYAAGMMDFEQALRLVTRRGAAMQAAATAAPSGMVSIMGLDEAGVHKLCQAAAAGQVLTPANFNCPGQIVVSGQVEACQRAEAMAKDMGASGAMALKVAGAFHSDLMAPAAEELAKALEAVDFCMPHAPSLPDDPDAPPSLADGQAFASQQTQVIANVNAQPYGCPCGVKDKLLSQLTGAVRWQQCMEFMLAQGVQTFYEIGPGRVLAGLARRIDRKAAVVGINSSQAVEKLATG